MKVAYARVSSIDQNLDRQIVEFKNHGAEKERTESKRRQAQGIKIAKEKGVYQGRPILYGPDARDPQKQAVYYQIVQMLNSGLPIKKIAEKNGVTRPTVYRIQKELKKGI
ncbi:recombinase family protein [Bacillus pseudomycoides]|uniref:recombinase family protein n=1 Tax=Bacillus TaxID=1386 RepID=UPI002248EB88|nr:MULTISPECIES: recombinase family protein [Bacillus]MCX2829067.1 recombinase family protein [Bacillus sp. DHT2]MDR4918936.1 recombinase family protein [Bacillus pseudomycoides]